MKKYLVLGILCAATAAPAHAGTMTYTNGATSWRATGCTQPQAPVYNNGGADALSGNISIYNTYSKAVEAYLGCVTQEANADMKATNTGIASELARVNTAWQQDLAQKKADMEAKRHP